jgi:hypothetical protein
MKNTNFKNEAAIQDKSQREIENNKSKRQVKKALKRFEKMQDCENEEIYSNFEKFNNRNR